MGVATARPSPSVWQTPTSRTVRYQELSPRNFRHANSASPAWSGPHSPSAVPVSTGRAGCPQPAAERPHAPLFANHFQNSAGLLAGPYWEHRFLTGPDLPPRQPLPVPHSASHQPQGGCGVSPGSASLSSEAQLVRRPVLRSSQSEEGSFSEVGSALSECGSQFGSQFPAPKVRPIAAQGTALGNPK